MKMSGLVLFGCLAAAPVALAADSAVKLVAASGATEVKLPPSSLFDRLGSEPDVVYLIANSSLVFGPDPHGRSEEITFLGPVTVPKWPMAGYGRRVLADGRQQIDIELTQSELTGESYVLHGPVVLGEHPDLRSLGTITERPASTDAPMTVAQMSLQNRSMEQLAQQRERPQESAAGGTRLQAINENKKKLSETVQQLTAPGLSSNEQAARFNAVQPSVSSVLNDLSRLQAVDTEVVPADFVVERKVLMTTAKGILYNETAVPVRGRIDSIPPVKLEDTPTGVNVFRGMELPTPLLDKDGNVNGWFYSKSHMAYAVLPTAIERSFINGAVELKAGDKTEKVEISGPAEIHHLTSLGAGEKTDIEVMMLALRGRSELLGGDIMFTETFSDRDYFSRGQLSSAGGSSAQAKLDLFVDLITPSTKLTTREPLPVVGQLADSQKVTGRLEKGRLSVPFVGGQGRFETSASRTLYDEVERPVVEVIKMELDLRSN